MALADAEQLARFVVVNRLDRERASFATALEDLQAAFGRTLVPVQLPYGEEKGFRGVIDLVAERAYTYEGGTGRGKPVAIPESLAAQAKDAREALVELVAEADDELMSRFFDEGTLTDDELLAGLRTAVRKGAVVPVFCTSGIENIGADRLLEALTRYAPSPSIGRSPPSRRPAAHQPRRQPTRARRHGCSSGRPWRTRSRGGSRSSAW